ncbi:MAG: ferredoxin-thioredoxin reductase catalytic domain-containing protein [Candidatus Helarchaeota archaeon]
MLILVWTRETIEKVANKKGWKLNPDDEVVKSVIDGLNKNKEKYGFYYCPCRIVEGDKEKDKFKICPCKWSAEEVERDGHCHCMLYFKKD